MLLYCLVTAIPRVTKGVCRLSTMPTADMLLSFAQGMLLFVCFLVCMYGMLCLTHVPWRRLSDTYGTHAMLKR